MRGLLGRALVAVPPRVLAAARARVLTGACALVGLAALLWLLGVSLLGLWVPSVPALLLSWQAPGVLVVGALVATAYHADWRDCPINGV